MYFNNNPGDTMDTRNIVVDYVKYRLERNGYVWQNGPAMENGASRVCNTMRSIGDEFEERYRSQFEEMGNQLHITPTTAYPTFHAIVNELFADGVNWGRVVALFTFGGSLAVRCFEQDMPQIVDSIIDWVSTYADNNLSQWISGQSGWEGFVAFYEQGPEKRNENPWPSLRQICGYAAGAIGVLTLGAILTQKS
ncbi:bcl-2-like protein 2 [Haliotis cracherodii]|uniref:bcl-2-like protein 2 n=1 Tax=Haliotis rufescens TaxID=6454 RepID=UPI001EB02075|nr:bcl-2-like protein 2 [Haliotis rufescens]